MGEKETESLARFVSPAAYRNVRELSLRLARRLSAEDQTAQSMPDVSPTKWHLAHTTWFFETFVLRQHVADYQPFCAEFEVLFNSYYNSVGSQFPRAARGVITRPGASEVLQYRQAVDEALCRSLSRLGPAAHFLVELGLHHEQQHQELLLTDIKHVLSRNPTHPVYVPPTFSLTPQEEGGALNERSQAPMNFLAFEGGQVSIGAAATANSGFCYDNEGPAHEVLLRDFELSARPINNADVLQFIAAGGYRDPLLWLSDGALWLQKCQRKAPLYWLARDDDDAAGHGESSAWRHFTLHGLQPIDPQETAAHLSFFEADAIARFFQARLPSEQEWEWAAHCQMDAGHWLPERAIYDERSPIPGRPQDQSPGRLAQLFGGCWEWTQSAYLPYPGYQPPSGAVGEYNGKFMHNQMVLRGGSCVTPPGHLRATYRNFFPSDACWQFSGARLARDVI